MLWQCDTFRSMQTLYSFERSFSDFTHFCKYKKKHIGTAHRHRCDKNNGWLDGYLELRQIKIEQESRSTTVTTLAVRCLFAKMKMKTTITVTQRGILLLFFSNKKIGRIKWLSYGIRITASIDGVSELSWKFYSKHLIVFAVVLLIWFECEVYGFSVRSVCNWFGITR